MTTYQQSYSRKGSNPLISQCENYPNQLENIAEKERFGLFSQPPGLSIGDHYSRQQRNAGPRGILTNPKLASSVEPSLFQFPNFTSINDPYKEPYKIKQINDKYRESNIPHNHPFKHTDNKKTVVGSEFEHMKEYDNKSYNTRKPDGSVKTKPRGFYTQPGKKGFANTTVGHLFGHIPYNGDPYDRPKQFDVQDRAEHKSKIIHPNKPFISTQQRNNLFSSNNGTYGDKGDEQPRNTKNTIDYRGMTHTTKWRPGNPAKKGFNKTIGRFPEYYEEGDPRLHKKRVPYASHDRTWKPNSKGTFARPTPSISNLVTNFNKMTSFRH